MLGCDDPGLPATHAIALNAAVNGSIFAVPEACFVITMALPLGSTRALLTAQAIRAWPPRIRVRSASFRSAVLIARESFQPWFMPTMVSCPVMPTFDRLWGDVRVLEQNGHGAGIPERQRLGQHRTSASSARHLFLTTRTVRPRPLSSPASSLDSPVGLGPGLTICH